MWAVFARLKGGDRPSRMMVLVATLLLSSCIRVTQTNGSISPAGNASDAGRITPERGESGATMKVCNMSERVSLPLRMLRPHPHLWYPIYKSYLRKCGITAVNSGTLVAENMADKTEGRIIT